MIVARLRSYGVSSRRVAVLVLELWAVFALWIGVLWAASVRVVPPGGIGGGSDVHEALRRFSALGATEKALTVISVVLGLAVFAHFNWALRTAMQERRGGNDEG